MEKQVPSIVELVNVSDEEEERPIERLEAREERAETNDEVKWEKQKETVPEKEKGAGEELVEAEEKSCEIPRSSRRKRNPSDLFGAPVLIAKVDRAKKREVGEAEKEKHVYAVCGKVGEM